MGKTLNVTTDQLVEVCRTVYEPSGYVDAPAQLFIEHAWGEATFLRASFPERFTPEAAEQLSRVRRTLQSIYGQDSHVVMVIYEQLMDPVALAERSIVMADR